MNSKHICNSLNTAHKPKITKELATFVNKEKEIFKNALRATKKKKTECYIGTLEKAATKTQHCV